MRPEELEDLWHLFNLISRGDHLRAKTLRKVSKQSSTGTVSSQRVLMLLWAGHEGWRSCLFLGVVLIAPEGLDDELGQLNRLPRQAA